jgi:putative membrane protein
MAGERTNMASFRTELALDRTTLAWVRTTLTMASFGLGLVSLSRSLQAHAPSEETARLHEGAIRFGVVLIVLGTGATALAGLSHWFTLRRLRREQPLVLAKWPLTITVAFLLTLLCMGGLWSAFDR